MVTLIRKDPSKGHLISNYYKLITILYVELKILTKVLAK